MIAAYVIILAFYYHFSKHWPELTGQLIQDTLCVISYKNRGNTSTNLSRNFPSKVNDVA